MSSSGDRPIVKACHVCEGTRIYYLFSTSGHRVVRCEDCGLTFLNPQPSDAELAQIRATDGNLRGEISAELCLAEIRRYRGPATGRLLEIGCGTGDLLASAEATGWQVVGMDSSAASRDAASKRLKQGTVLAEIPTATEAFDVCVVSNALEHERSPHEFLQQIHGLLKPNGTLLVVTEPVDAWSARYLRQQWNESNAMAYFDTQALQTILFKASFHNIVIQPGLVVLGQKAEPRPSRVLSVIVPAYNEGKTFSTLLEAVLRKEIPGAAVEIIVVESNSADGTREAALKYKDHPRVKLVLQDRPRGKGNAVQAGLSVASGDYVLIQDADLEYDLEDYDALLEPLLAGRVAFVLGSRHGGRNVLKMRQFAGEHGLSIFFNLGHWFFTALINVLYLQRLRDPFTMFKVFRRDCLFGLEFECHGFDFDFELLIKLIRKGYRPIELPVNYRSRSFREGKKVRMFRDPITWLRALLRLRFVKIDPMEVVERTHATHAANVPAAHE